MEQIIDVAIFMIVMLLLIAVMFYNNKNHPKE
jgi:hypothetical protein